MFASKRIFGLATVATFAMSLSAWAGEATFTKELFQKYQAEGKSILVDISAPWCPTCRAQAPVIQKLAAEERFKDFEILKIDFDSAQDDVAAMGANRQSTLIVFKGATETGRSIGQTRESVLAALFETAL